MSAPGNTAVAEVETQHIDNEFFRDVVSGLRRTPKKLAPKYFYDAQGSRYFDEICTLEEYYPYRTELQLLPRVAADLSNYFAERHENAVNIVEFGAGSLHKIKPLLKELEVIRRFTAIDISGEHLQASCALLARHFPDLDIRPLEGDFTKPLQLNAGSATPMGFFPGSTIGNLTPEEAQDFLLNARLTLGAGSYMLLGVDTKKDEQVLNRAYNDSHGLTAQFNKNVLARINRELGADFRLANFEHQAWYNADRGRIEMHLRSRMDQTVVLGKEQFEFREGETIHTENSYKYHPGEFDQLVQEAGWKTEKWWLAEKSLFSVTLLWNP